MWLFACHSWFLASLSHSHVEARGCLQFLLQNNFFQSCFSFCALKSLKIETISPRGNQRSSSGWSLEINPLFVFLSEEAIFPRGRIKNKTKQTPRWLWSLVAQIIAATLIRWLTWKVRDAWCDANVTSMWCLKQCIFQNSLLITYVLHKIHRKAENIV